MTASPLALPECWGVDTSEKLGPESARALAASTFQGRPIRFVWRYVFFGPARAGDLSPLERDAILAAGLGLLVVQHVRFPEWVAGADAGQADGLWAVRNAVEAGYVGKDLSLALDLEGVANSGEAVSEHCEAWGEAVLSAGFHPVLYVGYQCGLTPAQLYALHNVDRYWSDFGPRKVDTRSFCCKQLPQTTIAGVKVDPDYAHPDLLGGTLTALSGVPGDAPEQSA